MHLEFPLNAPEIHLKSIRDATRVTLWQHLLVPKVHLLTHTWTLNQAKVQIPLKCTWNSPEMHLGCISQGGHPKSLLGSKRLLALTVHLPHLLVHPRAFNQGTLLPLTCTMAKPVAELGRYLNPAFLRIFSTLQGWVSR